jgi:polyhydroxybutyrate depolymerase
MRTSHVVPIAVFVIALASTARAQSLPASCDRPHASGVTQEQLVSGERQREYRLFVPPSYDGRTALPLVLELHGSGGTAAGQAKTSGLEGLAARERFAVASLQADGGRWNVPIADGRPDDVAYVSDVIDHVAARLCIDRARVHATGFSGGGRMTSLLGCRLSSRIASIAPVAGLRWPAPCEGRPVPVLTFHGLGDAQNPYQGQAKGRGAEWLESVPQALAGWAARNGCSAEAVTEDPDGPISIVRYEMCSGSATVRLIRIDGLGHTWPRNEVDATTVMWEFFRTHDLRP